MDEKPPEETFFFDRASVPAGDWLDRGWATLDDEGCILEINEELVNWLRADRPALVGQSLLDLLERRRPEWKTLLRQGDETKRPFETVVLPVASGGPACYELEIARHVEGSCVRLSSVLPSLENLSELEWEQYLGHKQAKRDAYTRLLGAERRFQAVTRRWPGVVFSQRADLSFLYLGPRVKELTGVAPEQWLERNPFWQLVHEADAQELQQQLKGLLQPPHETLTTYRIRHAETGRLVYLMEYRQATLNRDGAVLGYDGVWLDVTRQTIAEKRLSTAAWKETLAVLTMGLAHDFSNVMAGIHSLSESFLSQVKSDHPFYEGLGLIKQNSMQASQLVHRIINLHRGKVGERDYHDLNQVLNDLVELIRKIIPGRFKVQVEPTPEEVPIYGDVVELRQVIINMALNAAEAMGQAGQLTLATARYETLPELQHYQGTPPRVPAVCLSISDTGAGIAERHLSSIFDPFFTTKAMNKGSGLGLYNARLFVEKHRGAISLESEEGVGSTFRLWLPVSDFTEAEQALREAPADRKTLLVAGQSGRMLEHTAEFLRLNGYHVATAASKETALELLKEPDYRFVGLMVLAELGDEPLASLIHETKRRQPEMKIILQTIGASQDEWESRMLQRADLLIHSGLAQETILAQLNAALNEPI